MSGLLSYGLVFGPGLAAPLGLLLGRRRAVSVGLALLGSALSLGCAVALVVQTWSGTVTQQVSLLGSLDLGSRTVRLEYSLDGLTALVAVAVSLVSLGVQLYSAGYLVPHAGDTGPLRYRPYAATVSLFSAAMLVVIGADDLLLLLLGWEVMGFCSYLLIGHHSERDSARRAALQAFLVTRLADVGFVVGIVALYAIGGTTNVPTLLRLAADGSLAGHGVLLSIAVLGLVIGVMGKSAQFPLHGWLPDAMEGPTPVSALIHAATMVAAGVVVLARFGPLLEASDLSRAVLAVVAVVSMLAAGLAALCADDLKRVLAWSTISQIAIMLAAVTLGTDTGRAAAIMLMLAHAAFKALLFLSAGMISLRFGTTALAGLADLRRRDPRATVLLGIGLAGLAGLPPLAGFIGKEAVLTAAEHVAGHPDPPAWLGTFVFGGLTLTALLTALYSGRLFAAVSRLDLAPTAAQTGSDPTSRLRTTAPLPEQVAPSPVQPSPVQPGPVQQQPTPTDDQEGQPPPGSVWPAAPGRTGPDFARPGTPSRRRSDRRDESMSFVDDRGQYQDWDLIAGLDSSRPAPWSQEARERRAAEAAEARRRSAAGIGDETRTRRAHREGRPDPSAVPPNRLARAVADRRDVPTAQSETGPRPSTRRESRLVGDRPIGGDQGAPRRRAQSPRRESAAVPPPLAAPGPVPPWTMQVPVLVLAVATVLAGALPFLTPALRDVELTWLTAGLGTVLAIVGIAIGQVRGPSGHRDPATRLPSALRGAASGGFGYQRVQEATVVRPVRTLARLIATGDDAVIGTWVRAPHWLPWIGLRLARLSRGGVTGYLGWVGAGAVLIGILALLGTRVLG